MADYQITATITEINFGSETKLKLKGSGKYVFASENDPKVSHNILEHTADKTKSILLDPSKEFYIDINDDKNIASNMLSHAYIENKRLKFEIKYNSIYDTYNITSISKAD